MSDFIIRTTVDGFCTGVDHFLFLVSYIVAVCFMIGVVLVAYIAMYTLVQLCELSWRNYKVKRQRRQETKVTHRDLGETYTKTEQNHYTLSCVCGARAGLYVDAVGRFTIRCPKCGQTLSGRDPDGLRVTWSNIQREKREYSKDGKNKP